LPAADVQDELNERYYQACLQFDVQSVPNPNPVHWDVSAPLNKLNCTDLTETNVFAGDPQFNGHVPVIFVRAIDGSETAGFARYGIHRIFMDDSKVRQPGPVNADGSQESRVRFIAHEVGHYFQISSRDPDRVRLTGVTRREYHDTGAFPPSTTGLMKPSVPGKWVRHEDWKVMWENAQAEFPNRFPQ
jgi:hypothetical protein